MNRLASAQFTNTQGCFNNADVTKHGASGLGEEALNEIEPGAVRRGEDQLEAALGLRRQPGLGFARDVCRVIVENDLDRG